MHSFENTLPFTWQIRGLLESYKSTDKSYSTKYRYLHPFKLMFKEIKSIYCKRKIAPNISIVYNLTINFVVDVDF